MHIFSLSLLSFILTCGVGIQLDNRVPESFRAINAIANVNHRDYGGLALHHSVLRSTSNRPKIPIIILHGLLGSSRNFQSWTKLLYKKMSCEHDIICIDLKNHGRSSFYGSSMLTYENMVLDIEQTLLRLNVTKAHFVGHSMGGKVAAAVALSPTTHSRVHSLTMMDISPVPYTRDQFSSVITTVETLVKISQQLSCCTTRRQLTELLENHFQDASLQAFLLSNIQQSGGAYGWKFQLSGISSSLLDILDFPFDATTTTFEESYSVFQGKLLLLKAVDSGFVRSSHIPPIQKLFPSYILAAVRGAGHWLHIDKPEETTDIVSKFLNSVTA